MSLDVLISLNWAWYNLYTWFGENGVKSAIRKVPQNIKISSDTSQHGVNLEDIVQVK
jgi:hypothetical protein